MSILRSIFMRPDYRSEVTQFIDDLKAKKPELDQQQVAGRALLWDKNLDRSELAEFRDARVPQQAYVYQTRA